MIRITREPLPHDLADRLGQLGDAIRARPAPDRKKHADQLWKQSSVRRGVHARVIAALRQMAAGLELCMYCSDSRGTSIDHFEPRARNPARTFDWLNHLLACQVCNSNLKRDQFPVDDRGVPLLIDPTDEDPFDHLSLSLSLGVYTGKTPKGHTTIDVFGLNRGTLPRGRQLAVGNVEALLHRWADAAARRDPGDMAACVRDIRDQPAASVCQAMLRQAASPNAAEIFDPEILRLLRHPDLRAALLR